MPTEPAQEKGLSNTSMFIIRTMFTTLPLGLASTKWLITYTMFLSVVIRLV